MFIPNATAKLCMLRFGVRRFSSAIQQIEKDGARILRIVKKRVDERASLASQVRPQTHDASRY